MATAFQIIGSIFILLAAVYFVRRNRKEDVEASTMQMLLAVYQVTLCGWFFALCLSDILDIGVNFSYVRLILDVFYIIAFTAISVYTLFYKFKNDIRHLRCVIYAYILLIVAQCFVFPYPSETELLRIFESLEGALVYGLLVATLFKLDDHVFSRKALIIMVILELSVAIENVIVPFATITGDFQLVDIPLNYASLFMRPVLFASLALVYRVWLDRQGIAIGR